MPELPEVETIRLGLQNKVSNKKITGVTILYKKAVKGSLSDFVKILTGNAVKKINRIGKLLILELADGHFLLIHLKMTGQLIYACGKKIIAGGHNLPRQFGDLPDKSTSVVFDFADDCLLFFNDIRKLGYLRIVNQEKKEKIIKEYGPEPLTSGFTFAKFKKFFANRQGTVKSILMNQKLIAGIGNIYADEICFYARVKPDRTADSLVEKEIKDLYNGCNEILAEAIKKRGTTFSDYVDAEGKKGGFKDFLKVYKREGQKCLRCGKGIIKKAKMGGRGTRYCDKCQI